MNVYEKLLTVQTKLKAPKSQYNAFGKYNYRNCEDILEAVKPLCAEVKAVTHLTDKVVLIGERYYVEATAHFIDVENENDKITVCAYAREEETKKGMDGSQVTGASSSYARKYALNGLFDIDDTKDSDTTNTHGKDEKSDSTQKENVKSPTTQKDKTDKKLPTPREKLIAKLHELKIDVNVYAKEKGLSNKTTAAEFEKLLAELESNQ